MILCVFDAPTRSKISHNSPLVFVYRSMPFCASFSFLASKLGVECSVLSNRNWTVFVFNPVELWHKSSFRWAYFCFADSLHLGLVSAYYSKHLELNILLFGYSSLQVFAFFWIACVLFSHSISFFGLFNLFYHFSKIVFLITIPISCCFYFWITNINKMFPVNQ